MNILLCTIFVPVIMAAACLIFKRLAPWLALLTTVGELGLASLIFSGGAQASIWLALRSNSFSTVIFLAAALFTFLITLYSFKALASEVRVNEYYAYILLTIGVAAGALFATDLFTLLLFWGTMGIPLYMLIGIRGAEAAKVAQKSLLIVGGADALMIIGIGIVWMLKGSLQITVFPLPLNNHYAIGAFLALAAGAFAKAGVMPFHSWIPDSAEQTPASVMALLPASLDKLLGIYLLIRICFDIFLVLPGSPISIFLLAIGSITIVAAVLGAMFQHDFRKLLSFHAVSQVGYMVLGIGTGTTLGVAGGLFHMFNHAIYKSCLFLCGGAVEKQTGTTELKNLGGLATVMPLTFTAFLIAALSISGVPPFNGFASKWLIYQALVQLRSISPLWIVWLVAAMFGSAFTLASFVKVIHAVFLGQGSAAATKAKEVAWQMWIPMLTLAALCVIFGLWAFELPLRYLVVPVIGQIRLNGSWAPLLAAELMVVGLVVGLLIFWLGNVRTIVTKPVFTGGEILSEEEIKIPAVNFYDTIKQIKPLAWLNDLAARRWFDLYEWSSKISLAIFGLLARLQNGLQHTYLAWFLVGMAWLFYWLLR